MLLNKLWIAAKIQGHSNPFHPELLSLTIPQIDFILEKTAIDHPDQYVYTRPGREVTTPDVHAAWYNVFQGAALARFMAPYLNLNVLRKRKEELAAKRKAETPAGLGFRGKGLKDGFTTDAGGADQPGRKPDGS